MRASKDYFFRACYSRGASHCHLPFGRDSKADRGWESFTVEKGEAFRCALDGGCWLGKAGDGLPGEGHPELLRRGIYLALCC